MMLVYKRRRYSIYMEMLTNIGSTLMLLFIAHSIKYL